MAVYISESDVAKVFDMPEALELVEEAFLLYAKGEAFNTPRTRSRIKKGALHILPAAMPTKGVIGYKAYTSFKDGNKFRIYLHSAETGEMLAVIEASEIGRLRTGAASGVATKYLAPKDASRCLIFGAGYQAEAQLEAIDGVRKLTHVDVVNLTKDKGVQFADIMSKKLGVPVVLAADPKEAAEKADIITTITWSVRPVIDRSWKLKEGVHINAAGSNALIRAELPESIVESSFIVVDDVEVAKLECGDLLPSLEKGRVHWNGIRDLGSVILNGWSGKAKSTLFESQGMGLLDIACAEYIYRAAMNQKLGAELPF